MKRIVGLFTIGLILILLRQSAIPESGGVAARASAIRNPQSAIERLVRLNVVAADEQGKPVTDLSQDDFTVVERGEPQKIVRFIKPSAPLRVLLLVDNSGSMVYAFPRLQQSLSHFVSLLGLYDEISVVSFARDQVLETDFSVNPDRVKNSLASLEVNVERNEVTRLYDAFKPALDHVRDSAKGMRTALILYTDGIDGRSQRYTEKSSLRLVGESFVTFYVIQARGRDRSYLKNLAEVTAGRSYLADEHLEKNLEELAPFLRSHYVLGYVSTTAPDKKRVVSVEVKVARPGIRVTAPQFYRVPPDS